MNKHEKRVQEYEKRKEPVKPTKENLAELTKLCKEIHRNQQEFFELDRKIRDLRLPPIITNFAKGNPTLDIVGVTDEMCSVFCVADELVSIPQGAKEIKIEDNKLSFKVLID